MVAALLVSVGLPLVSAGDILASNSLLSIFALFLVGLLGRAARLKALLLYALTLTCTLSYPFPSSNPNPNPIPIPTLTLSLPLPLS